MPLRLKGTLPRRSGLRPSDDRICLHRILGCLVVLGVQALALLLPFLPASHRCLVHVCTCCSCAQGSDAGARRLRLGHFACRLVHMLQLCSRGSQWRPTTPLACYRTCCRRCALECYMLGTCWHRWLGHHPQVWFAGREGLSPPMCRSMGHHPRLLLRVFRDSG